MENDEVVKPIKRFAFILAILWVATVAALLYQDKNYKADCEALGQIGTTRTEFSMTQGCLINLKGIMVPVSKMAMYRNNPY